MRVKLWFVAAAVALMVSLAAADDPWQDAAYEKWNDKDVQKILKSSPWGRELVTKYAAQSSENKKKSANSTVNQYDQAEQTPSEWVQVVWWSSKTVRRAVLRRVVLKGTQVAPEQSKQFTETPMDDHVIVLWGDPKTLAALARLEPADLQKVAYLDSPRLKTRIDPTYAGAVREGKAPPDKIQFQFPRKLNGEDTVTEQDGRLVFKWRLLRNTKTKIEDAQMFEVVFNPTKMVSGGLADY